MVDDNSKLHRKGIKFSVRKRQSEGEYATKSLTLLYLVLSNLFVNNTIFQYLHLNLEENTSLIN